MIIECPTIGCQKVIVISEIDHILKDADSAKEFIKYLCDYANKNG